MFRNHSYLTIHELGRNKKPPFTTDWLELPSKIQTCLHVHNLDGLQRNAVGNNFNYLEIMQASNSCFPSRSILLQIRFETILAKIHPVGCQSMQAEQVTSSGHESNYTQCLIKNGDQVMATSRIYLKHVLISNPKQAMSLPNKEVKKVYW